MALDFKNKLKNKLNSEKKPVMVATPPAFAKQTERFLERTRVQVVLSTMVNSCLIQICVSPSKMEAYLNLFFI